MSIDSSTPDVKMSHLPYGLDSRKDKRPDSQMIDPGCDCRLKRTAPPHAVRQYDQTEQLLPCVPRAPIAACGMSEQQTGSTESFLMPYSLLTDLACIRPVGRVRYEGPKRLAATRQRLAIRSRAFAVPCCVLPSFDQHCSQAALQSLMHKGTPISMALYHLKNKRHTIAKGIG